MGAALASKSSALDCRCDSSLITEIEVWNVETGECLQVLQGHAKDPASFVENIGLEVNHS